MKRLILLLTCFIISIGLSIAQTTRVTGIVLDENGEPAIGASVTVKENSAIGANTNVDGKFTLDVPDTYKMLVVKYLGAIDQEVAVAPNITVTLKFSATALDEVLVVAYGTTKKSSFTGSASTIRGEKLTKGQTSNVSKSLEGTVAGVQISSATGQPGASASIRVRGFGSISAGQNPLIIVDGVPYEGSLNSISPQDIETLNVLKDAAANSMYGARGSNGVILITTKKGISGKTKVNFDGRFGVNSRAVPDYNVIKNAGDYYELIWEANRNKLVESGMSPYSAGLEASNQLIPNYLGYNVFRGINDAQLIDPVTGRLNPAATDKKWSDDWQKDGFRTGFRQEYNFSVSGGTENTSAYMSMGYLGDEGYVNSSDFERISARVKVDHTVSAHFKTGMNIAYSQTNTNAPVGSTGSSSYSNIFMFSQQIAPIYPIYKYDLGSGAPLYENNGDRSYDFGSLNVINGEPSIRTRAYAGEQNPLYVLAHDADQISYDNLSSRAYAEFKFLTDFTFTANIAYDIFSLIRMTYTNPSVGNGKSYGGIGGKENERYEAINANQLLNYTKKIGNDHNIEILLGHETKMDNIKYLYGQKMQFYDPFNPEFANAGSTSGLTSYVSQYRLDGYFSRAEYNYQDKYYISGSFRRDASSKFHPDVRWGNFWSTGVAWRIKEESFLQDVESINNLRVRASYGIQGNDNIDGSNLYLDQFEITTDGTNPSPVFSYRGAPNLTWEKSNNFNAGIELRLFDLIELNGDFFIKETKDMLYKKPLSPSLGAPTWIWDNQIDMKNTGFEVELIANPVKTNDIKWDVSVNLTTYKNKLTKLPDDKTDPKGYASGVYWRKLGGSLYDFYTYEYAGIDESNGKSLWNKDVPVLDADGKPVLDKDGNPKINKETTTNYSEATRYETGKSAVPDFYGGFASNLTAYGFDLSVQAAFQVGGYVSDGVYGNLMAGGENGSNWHMDIYKRWTPTNTKTDVPRISTGDQNIRAESDRWLTKASYFSLRNITLGYSLPKKTIDKFKIESLRLYATTDNLWFHSARKGLDPRMSFDGTVYTGVYSALTTTSIGIAIGF